MSSPDQPQKAPAPSMEAAEAAARALEDEPLADLIGPNIEVVRSLHARSEEQASRPQRYLEQVTVWIGRPLAVYASFIFVALWIATNSWLYTFDPPPYGWLQGLVSFAAFLTTLMVLARQNRQGHTAAKRAHLELQVNILTEQKIAKLIDLVEELRRDLPNVRDRDDPLARAMARKADPGAVMSALEDSPIGSAERAAPPTS